MIQNIRRINITSQRIIKKLFSRRAKAFFHNLNRQNDR